MLVKIGDGGGLSLSKLEELGGMIHDARSGSGRKIDRYRESTSDR